MYVLKAVTWGHIFFLPSANNNLIIRSDGTTNILLIREIANLLRGPRFTGNDYGQVK